MHCAAAAAAGLGWHTLYRRSVSRGATWIDHVALRLVPSSHLRSLQRARFIYLGPAERTNIRNVMSGSHRFRVQHVASLLSTFIFHDAVERIVCYSTTTGFIIERGREFGCCWPQLVSWCIPTIDSPTNHLSLSLSIPSFPLSFLICCPATAAAAAAECVATGAGRLIINMAMDYVDRVVAAGPCRLGNRFLDRGL